MSSHSHKISEINPKTSCGEIELRELFSDNMSKLCLSEVYSDVLFMVEGQRLPAHRVILAARSEYFRALLYGGLLESKQNIIQLKIPLEAFKALLTYIYSGHLSLSNMKEETVLDTLGLANQYGFTELETSISGYLISKLSLNNVCAILDAARLYNFEKLTEVCYRYMDRNAKDILKHKSFYHLSKDSIKEVIKRDSFFAPEVSIFLAVSEWCKENPDINSESVLSNVRLPLMDLDKLLSVVRNSGILPPEKLLDAIEEKICSTYLKYRGSLWPEKNIATHKFGSKTILGEWKSFLLDGDTSTYDMEKGYTRHTIGDPKDSGIVVELGEICIINHIKILLWDMDTRSYSYFVELSIDQKQWDRVIDYSGYFCRSWQYLYFPSRSVKYIKLVGTHNTANKVFHCVALEAMYTANVPKLLNDIIVPVENKATVEMGAIVLEGVSRTRNVLLKGDYSDYDWDSGYTCHQIGSGSILIQLGQPYQIGSMRLLLWDCDERNYEYYIETSVNQKDWKIVVDKRHEPSKSWQNLTFNPLPVIFIRIIGTFNTANGIFHCVHFECPSQQNPSQQNPSQQSPSQQSQQTENINEKK